MIVFEFWFWHSCSWLWQVYMGWKVNNISKMLSFEGMEWWTFGYHRCSEYSLDPNPVCLLTSKLGLNWHPGFVYSLFQSISELANIDLHRFCSQLCHSFNFNWSFTQRLESSNRLCDKCLFFYWTDICDKCLFPVSNHALAVIDPSLHRFGFFGRKVAASAPFYPTHPPTMQNNNNNNIA